MPTLDELRDLSRNSKQYIAQIEQRERQRTGIGSLKVKFNTVFGYYLEISQGEPAPRARRLRAQADAGECRALHHSGAEGVRGQGAGRAGEDGRDRAAAVRRAARGDRAPRRGASGRRRWRWRRSTCWRRSRTWRRIANYCRPQFDDSRRHRDRRRPASGDRAAGFDRRGRPLRPQRSVI